MNFENIIFRTSPPTKIRGFASGNDIPNRGGTPNSSIDLEWEIDGNLCHLQVYPNHHLCLKCFSYYMTLKGLILK